MIKGCERIVHLTTVTSQSLSLFSKSFRDISTAKLAKVVFSNGSRSAIPLKSNLLIVMLQNVQKQNKGTRNN